MMAPSPMRYGCIRRGMMIAPAAIVTPSSM
jgi:hypothetical protein